MPSGAGLQVPSRFGTAGGGQGGMERGWGGGGGRRKLTQADCPAIWDMRAGPLSPRWWGTDAGSGGFCKDVS